MEIDQKDRHSPNIIIELIKAIGDVHASRKSDPVRPISSQGIETLHNEQQTDERTTRIEKKLKEIDQNDQNPSNSIIS